MTTLHRLHNILFWILLACFLGTTGSILFFTFGYRFSFERGIFVYTGSVTIKSNPRDVRIMVDGKPFPENRISTVNRTLHLTGLRPGTHLLRVEADGFRSWEKKIDIRSGVSTEFWNIVLPRETYERASLLEGGLRKAFFSPFEHKFAIAAEEEGIMKIVVLDRDSEKSETVFASGDYVFDADSPENIEWSPDGKRLLVPVRDRENARTILLIDLDDGESVDFRTLSDMPEPREARWDPTDNRAFFALSEDSLIRVIPTEKSAEERVEVLEKNVAAYDLSGWTAYFLRTDGDTVFHAAIGGRNFEPVALPVPIPGAGDFLLPKLAAYDEKRVAVYDRGGSGYLMNDDGELVPSVIPLGSGMRGVQFSDDGKKLLFFTGNEISVAFTRDWEMQPNRESGEVVQIARFSAPVSHVQWSRDYEHVLFVTDHEIRITELDHRDRRNILTVASFGDDQVSQLLPDFGEGRIYTVSGRDTGKTAFSYIIFPEPAGFFGE